MPEAQKQHAGNPGLIKVECPVLGCGDVHRIPVDIQFAYGISETGSIDITIFPPIPDISRMSDHLAYEHGVF